MTHPLSEPLSPQQHDREDDVALCPTDDTGSGICPTPRRCMEKPQCEFGLAQKRYHL